VAGVARKLAVLIPTTPGPSQPASVDVMGSVMASLARVTMRSQARQLSEFLTGARRLAGAVLAGQVG
jgi:hypothetical protein